LLRSAVALWGLATAVLLAVGHPQAAKAHAILLASEPANEAALATAPSSMVLTFNEPVEPLTLRLLDSSGATTPVTQIARDGARLVLTPPGAIAEGTHVLSWRVISADGHPASGSLTFRIGDSATALPPILVSDNAPRRAAIWIARLAIYLGLFVGAGGAMFLAWVQLGPASRAARLVCIVACLLGLAATIASVGLQGLDIADLPIARLASTSVWTSGVQGSFGLSAAIVAAALLLGLASLRWRGAAARALSLAALGGVGVALAASGHASGAAPRYLTAASVVLHGCAVAFWIGGLIPLGLALGGEGESAATTLTRFSRAVPFAVAATLAAGIVLAMVQLSRLDALWTTDYGRVLCVKIGLVLLLLAIALWNRRRLTPRVIDGSGEGRRTMRRSIAIEMGVVVAILGAVGLWRFTPPPRALAAADDSFFTHLHTERAMANVTIAPGRAGPVEITVQLETSDETPLIAQAVAVTLSNPAIGIEPATADAQSLGNSQWRVKMSATVPGRWTLKLGILISDFDKVSVEAPVLIK
jgi:copper transport protein